MSDSFLDKAYDLQTPEDTLSLYGQWAASYDAEVAGNGYATPARLAEALARHLPDQTEAILDFGCGTGLSGLALRKQGFAVVDGMDPSAEMLAQARQKGAYRALFNSDVADPAPIPSQAYQVITACGVLGTGAAPPEVFDVIMEALPKGGLMAFSFNDHALADARFPAKLASWLNGGGAQLLFQEYGAHLPEAGLKSNVYVIEKA